jgi:hypothetical protein
MAREWLAAKIRDSKTENGGDSNNDDDMRMGVMCDLRIS